MAFTIYNGNNPTLGISKDASIIYLFTKTDFCKRISFTGRCAPAVHHQYAAL